MATCGHALRLVTVLTAALTPAAVVGQVDVSIPDDLTGRPGDTITVPVLASDAAGLEALDFELGFDTTLLDAVDARPGALLDAADGEPNLFIVNLDEDGGRVLIAAAMIGGLAPGGGALLEVDLEIDPGAANGDTPLDLSRVSINEEAIPVDARDGVLTIEAEDEGTPFYRGDPNGSGDTDLSDGVFVFQFLFIGGADPGCLDAADANNDGAIDLSDGIRILGFLFLGQPPLEAPGTPGQGAPCGPDPEEPPDDLDCAVYEACP